MKNLTFYSLAFSLAILASTRVNCQKESTVVINIKADTEIISERTNDQQVHSYREVEVLRMTTPFKAYEFVVYGMENDSIKPYSDFLFETDKEFKKASYLWESDTSVYIQLFNAGSEENMEFRLTGDVLRELGNNSTTLEYLN